MSEEEHRQLFYERVDEHLSGKDESTKSFSDAAFHNQLNVVRCYKSGVETKVLN